MNFHMVWKADIYLSIVLKFATIQNKTKQAKMKQCIPQPARSIHEQLFLNHVHNQAGFHKPVINGRSFIYLGISKMVFTF